MTLVAKENDPNPCVTKSCAMMKLLLGSRKPATEGESIAYTRDDPRCLWQLCSSLRKRKHANRKYFSKFTYRVAIEVVWL